MHYCKVLSLFCPQPLHLHTYMMLLLTVTVHTFKVVVFLPEFGALMLFKWI